MTSKTSSSPSAVRVKEAERRENSSRSSVPGMAAPPTVREATLPPLPCSTGPSQSSGAPDRSASGWAASTVSRNSSAPTVTRVR